MVIVSEHPVGKHRQYRITIPHAVAKVFGIKKGTKIEFKVIDKKRLEMVIES